MHFLNKALPESCGRVTCCSCLGSCERASKEGAGGRALPGASAVVVGWVWSSMDRTCQRILHGPFGGGSRPQWGSGQRGCAEDRQGVQEAWPRGWFLSQGIECLATKSCMHLAVCFLLCLVQATECFFSSFKEQVATNERILKFIMNKVQLSNASHMVNKTIVCNFRLKGIL